MINKLTPRTSTQLSPPHKRPTTRLNMTTTSPPQEAQQPHPTERLRTVLGENSSKFGRMAENVALPKNQRRLKVGPPPPPRDDTPTDVERARPEGVARARRERREDPPIQRPFFMLSISFLQVVLFYYGGDFTWLYLGYDPFRRHELWRYLSIMLVHTSGAHLWGNVLVQLILGSVLEVVHHWNRISLTYFAGVLGGSLAITALDPLNYAVGASAGVYALLTAHVATIIMNWGEMDNRFWRLVWLLLFIPFDIGLHVYIELVQKQDTYTSYAGHFGGAVVGFIVAVLFLRNFEKHPWERRFQVILAVVIAVLFGVVVTVNVAWPTHYRKTEMNFDYLDSYIPERVCRKGGSRSHAWELCWRDNNCRERLREFMYGSNENRRLCD